MIRIMTDSISDLTQAEAQEQGFTVLPLTVRFGDEEFRDGIDLTMDEFYERLVKVTELPQTSQVTPEAFVHTFNEELAEGDEVVCITGSSKLSGTYQSAVLARDMLKTPERVHLVDSRSASLGQALLVQLALMQRDSMGSAAELTAYLEQVKAKQHLVGQADELKYLVMGGRLSSIGAKLGTVLSIKPMLRMVRGKLEQAGLCRGSSKARAWYVEQLKEHPADPKMPMMIAGAHCDQAVSLLKATLEDAGMTLPPILVRQIGTVVGTHTGPGLTAMTWVEK